MAPKFFPPADSADEQGLVMIGGDLSAERLLDAYAHGIFPWPMWDDWLPMTWFSLDPRAIIELNGLHVSHRLARTMRSGQFTATCDRAFPEVMRGCSRRRKSGDGTWITPHMFKAFCNLYEEGHAHSVEVWQGEELAGGIYGVGIGGAFAGESMFHKVTDASKVALATLVAHLNLRGYQLFDIQQWTPHTGRMGAKEIPRRVYLKRLAEAIRQPVTFGEELECAVTDVPQILANLE
ncbi:leucyl/phenylalanyl-tRNA--protein transferase [Blastopirellula sp. JC732]|uniref:Leucyl/phenylalanyl-tRNA--protein transferase n=1 Tax=Blastopirellula sediminis TaxID=2894196 RepID=A0A9X1MI58_9BACT|nr:leucyl/phenylalanyl-tRNA--protein transferase [Blastopirellula sediminis]MCC9608191.1 leucyl/phenylalanyl-tRNA--protein transferase [Blastopirellula sediminis]MCC9627016.1 leucyl/phenylalanyl-tRNA--protein transferase [Blastopirellula sediminis]